VLVELDDVLLDDEVVDLEPPLLPITAITKMTMIA
jgi:hypothetical protein